MPLLADRPSRSTWADLAKLTVLIGGSKHENIEIIKNLPKILKHNVMQ